jgi:hypothetical protein
MTIGRHLRTLESSAPAVVPSYVAMARRTAERAEAAGRLGEAEAAAVIAVLDRS